MNRSTSISVTAGSTETGTVAIPSDAKRIVVDTRTSQVCEFSLKRFSQVLDSFVVRGLQQFDFDIDHLPVKPNSIEYSIANGDIATRVTVITGV